MANNLTKFKKTEIGPIPEEWDVLSIEDASDVIGGGTPSTKEEDNFNGLIPWITPRDLSNYQDRYISQGERNITEKGLDCSNAKLIPANSVLLTTRAPVGYLVIAKNEVATNQGFHSLISKKGIDNLFLFYLLKNNVQKLIDNASGSTFQELSGKALKSLKFAFPKEGEQKRIAEILGALDELIELNRRMNDTLEKIASAIFKHWFVDFASPTVNLAKKEVSQSEFIDSELGKIPKGWHVKKMGEKISVKGGSTPDTTNPDYWIDGNINWVTPKDLSGKTSLLLLDTEKKITEAGLNKISSRLLPEDTILLSSRAPIGYIAVAGIPVAINQGFIAINCEPMIWGFVLFWIKSNLDLIKSQANGSTFLEISKTNFKNIEIIVPDKNNLLRFDGLIRPIIKCMAEKEKEINNLSQIRDSLLPRLMSGKIRV